MYMYIYVHVHVHVGIPSWQNLTVKEVLSDLQLENLFEIFEREQVSELI